MISDHKQTRHPQQLASSSPDGGRGSRLLHKHQSGIRSTQAVPAAVHFNDLVIGYAPT
ncbi:hypothetical protein KTO58_27740 [Chitinophaga pendula]|uniref:hypothetical protein n=1 Tax=Chitinophaga TaxID=79328 RepID=UPI0012FD7B4E|nr:MULTISPECIES: hypothetical protein [Chitinophaga]UCJ07410.1 hypothetical protein KTO58_27740 [Chitinophaga pendula]